MRGDELLAQMACRPPFSRMHPKMAAFFSDYLSHEKAVRFDDRYVINTHLPPYPSAAFDRLVEQFNEVGDAATRRLFSVTLAVTNRCSYKCWHCYNSGRSQEDIPLETLARLAASLQELGAVHVTLTGGEPLLRRDLEHVASAFDDRTYLSVNTAGVGLTPTRAEALKKAGVFALGVSVDSIEPDEHDRLRGVAGAHRRALNAVAGARQAGLYPYIISVATRQFLAPEHFERFIGFALDVGALEVHLLEPCPTGRLAGRDDVALDESQRRLILEYQRTAAVREDWPIVSSFLYLESADVFGCGAGLTHLYIDGSGEVSPCNLVPISFGNAADESLRTILDRMGRHFVKPRCSCVGQVLAPHIQVDRFPLDPEESEELCRRHLSAEHAVPRFFELRAETMDSVGETELKEAYDQIHESYEEHWLSQAAEPIYELVEHLSFDGVERVMEAGCGTGFTTALVAERAPAAEIVAVDLSEAMLALARKRPALATTEKVRFVCDDALEVLGTQKDLDIVLSTWVLGYLPLLPFFRAAASALKPGCRLGFVVHRDQSPREALEVFTSLVAENPSVLEKRVAFDFPLDRTHVESALDGAGFVVESLWDGEITFPCETAEEALEHLLKSGAGTAFFHAVAPECREDLTAKFVQRLAERPRPNGGCHVTHEYIGCVARRFPVKPPS